MCLRYRNRVSVICVVICYASPCLRMWEQLFVSNMEEMRKLYRNRSTVIGSYMLLRESENKYILITVNRTGSEVDSAFFKAGIFWRWPPSLRIAVTLLLLLYPCSLCQVISVSEGGVRFHWISTFQAYEWSEYGWLTKRDQHLLKAGAGLLFWPVAVFLVAKHLQPLNRTDIFEILAWVKI